MWQCNCLLFSKLLFGAYLTILFMIFIVLSDDTIFIIGIIFSQNFYQYEKIRQFFTYNNFYINFMLHYISTIWSLFHIKYRVIFPASFILNNSVIIKIPCNRTIICILTLIFKSIFSELYIYDYSPSNTLRKQQSVTKLHPNMIFKGYKDCEWSDKTPSQINSRSIS